MYKAGDFILSMENVVDAQWKMFIHNIKDVNYETLITTKDSHVVWATSKQVDSPKGTYYVWIKTIPEFYSVVDVPYKFKIAYKQSNYYEKESIDTLETANTNKLNKNYQGIITDNSDKGYYKFKERSTGEMSLTINNKANL